MAPPFGPEIVVDLHGCSQARAKAVIHKTLADVSQDVVSIRFITGRGNHANRNGERAILFRNFNTWVNESAFKSRILETKSFDGYYELTLFPINFSYDSGAGAGAGAAAAAASATVASSEPFIFLEVLEQIRAKAESGDPVSQLWLGMNIGNKARTDAEFKESVKWFRKSAEKKNTGAMIALGRCYLIGRGVRRNDRTAVMWFQRAEKEGDVHASLFLGDCYWTGEGVDLSHETAVLHYLKSANSDDKVAMRKVASAYFTGTGVDENHETAFFYYKKSADSGDATSAYNTAVHFEKGTGTTKNPDMAIKYYNLAAELGDTDAQTRLGSFYLFGEHVAIDKQKAKYWLDLASVNGSLRATELLAAHFGSKQEQDNAQIQAAQSGDFLAMFEENLLQTGKSRDELSSDERSQLMEKSYKQVRDLVTDRVPFFPENSRFMLIDFFLADKDKRYNRKGHMLLENMAREGCIHSLRRLVLEHLESQNQRAALDYLKQGSELSDGKASCMLGEFCESDGSKDTKEMITFFELSVKQHYPKAAYFLGCHYNKTGKIGQARYFLKQALVLEKEDSAGYKNVFGFLDPYKSIEGETLLMLVALDAEQSATLSAENLAYLNRAAELGIEDARVMLEELGLSVRPVGISHAAVPSLTAAASASAAALFTPTPTTEPADLKKQAMLAQLDELSKATEHSLKWVITSKGDAFTYLEPGVKPDFSDYDIPTLSIRCTTAGRDILIIRDIYDYAEGFSKQSGSQSEAAWPCQIS